MGHVKKTNVKMQENVFVFVFHVFLGFDKGRCSTLGPKWQLAVDVEFHYLLRPKRLKCWRGGGGGGAAKGIVIQGVGKHRQQQQQPLFSVTSSGHFLV